MEISERIKYSKLFGIYKSLLTEKQQQIFLLYNENDVGYSEIAADFYITRQGVRDVILKVQIKLDEFETKLKILENHYLIKSELRQIIPMLGDRLDLKARENIRCKINDLIEKLEE